MNEFKNLKHFFFLILLSTTLFRCTSETVYRFDLVPANQTNVDFSNRITETDTLNYFKYPYLYMGGGVAIADFNNDNLQDIFLTGNMVVNKLYINKGNLHFEDVTSEANVSGVLHKWYTGVSVIDINLDGYMDIYLSVSGLGADRTNELYINNKDLSFTESAKTYNLADAGNTVQTTFFDYDNDGDLDAYLANYPITNFATSNFTYKYNVDHPMLEKSDHLYENLGDGAFRDVSEASGLLSYGLSLSAAVVDFNQDGWDDIYVSNDFSTPDQFYINNQDGTFTNHLKEITNQTSFYGMGTDAVDYNNDGLIDLFQVDMSAADNRRAKANMASMNPGLFWQTVNSGFHFQYMYNSLQVNRGLIDGLPRMSNVAWMSGISSTDWSWSPLFADFDNDGWKDLFVANGTRKEINNRDYFKKVKNKIKTASDSALLAMSDSIPSEPIDNYIFRNIRGEKFEKYNEEWNVKFSGFSNGTAYGDLDNDGDLDLVVNNIDDLVAIFRNNTESIEGGNYLRIQVRYLLQNQTGVEVQVYQNGQIQTSQLQTTRGFQSSVEPFLHFGLGKSEKVDSVLVVYQNKIRFRLTEVVANQLLTLDIDNASMQNERKTEQVVSIFQEQELGSGKPIVHQENYFDDYDYQVLIPHKMSNFGPALAVGDVNGDGRDDIYMGGASGFEGMLMIQSDSGSFESQKFQPIVDFKHEDLDAAFIDMDGDDDLDLYIVSGGNAFEKNSSIYQDRIYLNTNGLLTRTPNALPDMRTSGSRVIPYDYDTDGDLDLFIGGRLDPRNYPMPGRSYLLENRSEEGNIQFVDATKDIAPDLSTIGMTTDALWTDFNKDGLIDLLVVGEWMPITIFINVGGAFENQSKSYFDYNTTGWWYSIEEGDFDEDGDVDYIFGNLGNNYKYQAKTEESFNLYVSDFDENNKSDIVLSYHNFGEEYPVRGRQCSSGQIPLLEVAYKDYESYSVASMVDIFGDESLANSVHFEVENFKSIQLVNEGDGKFSTKELPWEAQISPINDMIIEDVNDDGHLDVILAGNLFASEVETPRSDGGMGLVMLGDGTGDFKPLSIIESGVYSRGDTKKVKQISVGGNDGFVVANNQGRLQLFTQ